MNLLAFGLASKKATTCVIQNEHSCLHRLGAMYFMWSGGDAIYLELTSIKNQFYFHFFHSTHKQKADIIVRNQMHELFLCVRGLLYFKFHWLVQVVF